LDDGTTNVTLTGIMPSDQSNYTLYCIGSGEVNVHYFELMPSIGSCGYELFSANMIEEIYNVSCTVFPLNDLQWEINGLTDGSLPPSYEILSTKIVPIDSRDSKYELSVRFSNTQNYKNYVRLSSKEHRIYTDDVTLYSNLAWSLKYGTIYVK
jgi:hypothetical protein